METQTLKGKVFWALLGIVFGCIAGLLLGRTSLYTKAHSVERFDNNGDGVVDEEIEYDKGRVARLRRDRNYDGEWDYTEIYGSGGVIENAETDDDFDGKSDGWMVYRLGNPAISKHDLDGNGEPDLVNKYSNGLVHAALCRPNGGTNNIRVEFFKHGVPQKEYLDVDGDGLIEVVVYYNQYGTRTTTEPVNPPVAYSHLPIE